MGAPELRQKGRSREGRECSASRSPAEAAFGRHSPVTKGPMRGQAACANRPKGLPLDPLMVEAGRPGGEP